jgi:pyridoxine kinase
MFRQTGELNAGASGVTFNHGITMAILSIQSHVCYGHVGNAAAVFPLQRLGFEVWPVHCLQFSNHPGYGDWSGEIFDAWKVAELLQGIERRGVLGDCEAVLSGYLGTADFGSAILETVAAVKAANPAALYLCDPVMGDAEAGIYVHPGIPAFFCEQALRVADIITPNLFELGILAGQDVDDRETAITAARRLLNDEKNRLKAVIVTSMTAKTADPANLRKRIGILAVTPASVNLVTTPELPFEAPLKGTGDAFAALFLGRYLRSSGDIPTALVESAASLYAVIQETHRRKSRELCLIEAQDSIAAPPLNAPLFDVIGITD